jgi:excisionase family DNA binding protein
MTTRQAISPAAVRAADPLLDRAKAADYLGVSRGTLEVWASTGRWNLPFIKVGARAKYRLSDLDAWLRRRSRCGHTDAAPPEAT